MIETIQECRECGDEGVEAGRGPGQLPWYAFALQFVTGRSVLDAGCGLGHGMAILRRAAKEVRGHDLDPRLAADDVFIGDLELVRSKSFDVVVSIDVVEHVEDPGRFLGHLARIAREGIFLTTPNWTASRCHWPYHRREYTPRAFEQLLRPLGTVFLYKGTPDGSAAYPVRWNRLYCWFNDLRSAPLTAFPARCWNNLVPRSRRIHSHNAAWVKCC
jgi:2-polyprenyl-3-methyl-5-hydroxy-6-metoxy-1,4-benzoquinol methylase